MPWLAANGLLPGLGMPAGAEGAAGAAGAAVAGVAVAAGASGALGAAGAGAEGAEGATASGEAAGAASALGPGFFTSGFGFAFGNASRSFLATGGVTVDDPPLTYSPSSFNLAKASLVSMPSSLAMSYTRGSAATFSPVWANPGRAGR